MVAKFAWPVISTGASVASFLVEYTQSRSTCTSTADNNRSPIDENEYESHLIDQFHVDFRFPLEQFNRAESEPFEFTRATYEDNLFISMMDAAE